MPEDVAGSHFEYPQPEWNGPTSVAEALDAVACASDEESSVRAYHLFLYAIGNNHAGTYYPVVLTTFTQIKAILLSGKSWPQHTIIEALLDLTGGFGPHRGYEWFQGRPLSEMLLEQVRGLEESLSLISTGNDRAAKSAKQMLERLK